MKMISASSTFTFLPSADMVTRPTTPILEVPAGRQQHGNIGTSAGQLARACSDCGVRLETSGAPVGQQTCAPRRGPLEEGAACCCELPKSVGQRACSGTCRAAASEGQPAVQVLRTHRRLRWPAGQRPCTCPSSATPFDYPASGSVGGSTDGHAPHAGSLTGGRAAWIAVAVTQRSGGAASAPELLTSHLPPSPSRSRPSQSRDQSSRSSPGWCCRCVAFWSEAQRGQ